MDRNIPQPNNVRPGYKSCARLSIRELRNRLSNDGEFLRYRIAKCFVGDELSLGFSGYGSCYPAQGFQDVS